MHNLHFDKKNNPLTLVEAYMTTVDLIMALVPK